LDRPHTTDNNSPHSETGTKREKKKRTAERHVGQRKGEGDDTGWKWKVLELNVQNHVRWRRVVDGLDSDMEGRHTTGIICLSLNIWRRITTIVTTKRVQQHITMFCRDADDHLLLSVNEKTNPPKKKRLHDGLHIVDSMHKYRYDILH